jgi:negative regulator of flagellin synthesis FlgM
MEISGKIPPIGPQNFALPADKKPEKVVQPGTGGERVAISDQAKTLQAAFQAVKQMDDMDLDKVARIKAQIKAGTYKVDADKAAGKLIEESLLGDLD